MFTKWLTANLRMNLSRRGLLLLVLSVALAVTASGCGLLPDEDEEEVLPTINPPKLSQKPVYTVTTDTLESRVRGIGELKSREQEAMFFIDDGKRIKDVYVKPGDAVSAGQLLAELDVSDMERDLRQRQLRFRQNELQMIEILRKADEMEPEQLEQAKIDFELAREELVNLEGKISDAKLYASIDGTVISVSIAKGDTSGAYKTIMTIADLKQLTVAATISKDDLRQIAVGMETIVNINAAGEFRGKVAQLPTATTTQNSNETTDSLDKYLLVNIEPFPEGLNLGTPLSVIVVTNRRENVTVIPSAALRTHSGRNYVQVEEEDGTKREVDVEVGQQTSTLVEIINGLTPGQKVVGR